ncbi:hypothetical protein MANES_11G150502v8 [Manihot esculenta]|uniref:Uncharacterized protein n=1 Tax=Manihot esculenta TaxID=3983 RepID=A0ACB7GY29_MANES|nr:hypothetical protein MANES_11G150502v8 [Manihot esculenta]
MFCIGCVLFSLPLSFLLHGVALSLLALFAFYVEMLAGTSSSNSQFKTRRGASSGILLGAVTLPAVMLSKLVQLSRAFSFHEIEYEELNHLAMQYWSATFASCFTVLIFLCLVMWHSLFGLICIVLCAAVFISSTTGTETTLKLLWMIFHGITAVKLVQHLLATFPSCASIGLVLYSSDMLACTISKAILVQYGIKRSEISTIIQGLLLVLLLFAVVFKFILHKWDCSCNETTSSAATYNERGRAFLFFASLGLIMVFIIPSWMQFVQDFQPVKRLSLCIYWVCVIYVSILQFYNISRSSKIERMEPKFLDLAFGAALAVFLTLEIIRLWKTWPMGQLIHQFMNAFTDHRDSDLLIVSHFSLLLGCALPFWMSSGYNDRLLAPFAGILSLGIGDTMASMVGHKYEKTIETTAAGIMSVLAACSVLLPILASTGYIFTQHWISLLLAVIVSGLLQAYTAQLDNAFMPLVFYSLLCL